MENMKKIIALLIAVICLTSFTTTNTVDKYEVLYDSKPIPKEGIKLDAGKSLQIVNKTASKIYKVELSVVLGKRPCYQKTYQEDLMKPIPVSQFMISGCEQATSIFLTINLSTTVVIPILQ